MSLKIKSTRRDTEAGARQAAPHFDPDVDVAISFEWNGANYKKRDIRVEHLLKLSRRAGAKWRSAEDVANLASGQSLPLDQVRLRAELTQMVAAARLGQLSRSGRCGILMAHHGALPFRLDLQFIDEQTAVWGKDGFVDVFMERAWLPEWAWQKYLHAVNRQRAPDAEPGWDLSEENATPLFVTIKRAAKALWPTGRPHHLKVFQVDDDLIAYLKDRFEMAVSAKTISRALNRKKRRNACLILSEVVR